MDSKIFFPTNEETKCAEEETQKVTVKWGELKQGEYYFINKRVTIKTKFGKKQVLHLIGEDNTQIKAWAPPRLTNELSEVSSNKEVFVKSFGLKPKKSDPTQNYHDYLLIKR